ncbi:MAG: hypothetical protein Q7U19_08320 [Methylotenera sp.]|nr:hypothetical protein [Methylotenera sp.]
MFKHTNRYTQKGVVLFFALIALVVMSLAAAALIRSVDTNSLIAGNLSFKQSSMLSADSGVETARAWILANAGSLEVDNAANAAAGYFATSTADARALVDASTAVATGSGIVAGTDTQGNTISFVVQRMCRTVGPSSTSTCLFGPLSKPVCPSETLFPPIPCALQPSLIYRVTARVVGPKNTVSYIQTFAY